MRSYTLHRVTAELDQYKNKAQELKDHVERQYEVVEAGREALRACEQRYSDCLQQLTEANALIDMHDVTIQTVRSELCDVKKSVKRAEGRCPGRRRGDMKSHGALYRIS